MSIINRVTPELIGEQYSKGIETVFVNEKLFYFSKRAVVSLNLKSGLFMHFDNDGKSWGLFVNKDEQGFPVISDKNGGFTIASRGLCRIFLRSIGKPPKSRFHLIKTNSKVGDSVLFEIITNKTAEEILAIKKDRKKSLNIKWK